MRKIIVICLLAIISSSAFSQSVVQRANAANTVADGRWMGNLNSFQPRYADTTAANLKIGVDSAGAIIYTYDIKGFWYRQNSPKKWVRIVSDNNLSNNFFFDTTCNCYKIDTTSLMGIINNFNRDSSIVSISVVNDSTIRICFGDGTCINIGITTTITNISNVYWLGGDTIAVCALDTTAGVVTTVCDTLTIGTQPVTTTYQNWLRDQGGNIIEFGSASPYTSPGLFLSHDTYTNTGYYRKYWDGYTVYDYPHQFTQQQSFQNGSGIVSYFTNGNSLWGHYNNVRLGINYSADTLERSPFAEGYFGRATGYSIGSNWTGHSAYGVYLDDNNSKTTGLFFHTYDSATMDGVTIYAAPDLGGSIPIFNGQLKNYRVSGFKTNLSIQHYGYGSGSSFISSDTASNKPLAVDANGNQYRMSNWPGSGNDSAFVKIEALTDTSYVNLRSNRSIPGDTIKISLANGQHGDITVTGGWLGLYNNFRVFPFQVGVTTNAAVLGATYFLLPSDYATKRVFITREGKQIVDTTNGVVSYDYLKHLDTIFLTHAVLDSERFVVTAYGDSSWTVDIAPTPAGYDPDAQAYFTAQSVTNTTDKTNINNLYVALKASTNPFTKIKRMLLGFGTGLVDGKTATTLTASSPPTVGATGYTLNGTTNYIDLGINATTLSNNEAHFFYQKTSSNGLVLVGANGGGVGTRIFPGDVTNHLFVRMSGGASDVNLGAAATAQRMAIWRNSVSTNRVVYRNNSLVSSTSLTANTPPSLNLFFGCSNEATTPLFFINGTFGIYILASGLTDAEALQIDAAIGVFITATGRN
jgi:hypothetical protein